MNCRNSIYYLIIALLAVPLHGCDVSSSDNKTGRAFSEQEVKSGGETTVFNDGSNAYSLPAPNLSSSSDATHAEGDKNFEAAFVTAPATNNGGLGPIFNNTSCNSCHVKDGRGKPFFDDGSISSVLVRLSTNGGQPGAPQPVEGFGLQLQNKAVVNKIAEAEVEVMYSYVQQEFSDGNTMKLRDPDYKIRNPYKSLPANASTSVRTAPPVFGLGLLEEIPKQQILANADPNDSNEDGISGKPNYVKNTKTGQTQLGRFGWKANQPTVRQQVATAYNEDMGITSPYLSEENIYHNPDAEDGLTDDPEISQQVLDETVFYTKTLGVPAKRNAEDPEVLRGKQLFADAGCTSCHTPKFTTRTNTEIDALSNQTIYPYTDLLLHDMGEGLADHRSDFEANGSEWRTPPLWGIGLSQTVNGHQSFLHDGRAQSIMEAILWHGGEAQESREYVKQLSESKRLALVKFVNSI